MSSASPSFVPIRAIRGCLTFLLLGLVSAGAAELKIVRILPGWRDADSFKRISEYFDGRENTGRQVVLRSQPAARAGYYFLTRLKNPGVETDVVLRVTLLTPSPAQPRAFSFPHRLRPGDTVFNLGVTGADWSDPKAEPVAWKLEVLAADGTQTLVAERSFLWKDPPNR